MEIKFVVKISDSDFYDKLKNNEISFMHGDVFYVDLNVTRVFNSHSADFALSACTPPIPPVYLLWNKKKNNRYVLLFVRW